MSATSNQGSRPEYTVISGSLREASLSRILANVLFDHYGKIGVTHQFIDLRNYTLPLCDGESAYNDPHVPQLSKLIQPSRVIIVATPIYTFDASAAVKNLVELTGSAWENKTVGFLCAAGGAMSYMSIMSLANSLMLDYRCLIIPRFVYAQEEDFTPNRLPNAALTARIQNLAEASVKIRYDSEAA